MDNKNKQEHLDSTITEIIQFNSTLEWVNPRKNLKEKIRFDIKFLDFICQTYKIELLEDYTNICLNRNFKIKGKCNYCKIEFNKTFGQMVATGPFCVICMKILTRIHIKNTCLERFGVECNLQTAEHKEKMKQTNLKNLGVEYPIQNPEIKEQIKKTNLINFGVENPFQNQEVKERIKQIHLKNLGVEYPSQSPIVQEKSKETNLINFGVENPFQSPEVREKIKQTNLKNFGVECCLQSPIIQEKSKETSLKNYGVEYPAQSLIVQEKMKQTNLKNLGVDNPFQSPEVREKIKQTNLKNFGVEYPMQNAEIASKTGYKYKEYIFPSGRLELVQGYEPHVLNMLLKQDILEDDILVKRIDVPEVWYIFEGKRRRYYTDIYIKSQNKCIEVKSDYTFENKKEENLAKQQAVKDLGLECEIWILNGKFEIIQILK